MISVKTERENPYESDKSVIMVESNFENIAKRLKLEFIPIKLPAFMTLYILGIENKIKELENEFENL